MPTNEAPNPVENFRELQFINSNGSETTKPTVHLSGALFLSGGALNYIGSAGTITEIAMA